MRELLALFDFIKHGRALVEANAGVTEDGRARRACGGEDNFRIIYLHWLK
jgi:hypothetical protein